MKRLIIPALICAGIFSLGAKAPKDPVLLTVNGQKVTLSEFEYFYHKNDGNEVEHETPEQYLDRFIDYKLKVAQAYAERQDTTAEFRKDFRQYRREISRPYLNDTELEQKILEDSYNHTLEEVKVDHLMLPLDRPELADSLRALLADGKADFSEIARKHSIDPSVRQNGGHYGWIHATEYPYEFEELVYNTPVGQVSEVGRTPYGLHIVRPTERRPNIGSIHGAHILVQIKEGRDSASAKALIDSIYGLLEQHQSFEGLAKKFSDCPSGRNGGDLDWFNRGQMVPEFDDVIFSLGNNEYSKPFTTRFGWHIAKKYESRMPSREAAMEQIKELIGRDSRATRPRLAKGRQLQQEYNTRVDAYGRRFLMDKIEELGYDSASVVLAEDPTPLIFVADSTITIGNFVAANYRLNKRQPDTLQIANRLNDRLISASLVYEDHRLEQKYPEFARQSKEYYDGLMLIASMEKNIWNRPVDDPEGLNAYFLANKDKYAYSTPRWKGYIIYSTSDSIIGLVDRYLKTVRPAPAVLGDSIKASFPQNVRIERVVLPQGENQIVDHMAFNGPAPTIAAGNRWKHYVTYLGHLIDGPEEVADVRGRVTNDWTQDLEKKYVDELRKKYPVKVNKKVLKKVK